MADRSKINWNVTFDFRPGDTYAYLSAHERLVVWTRDEGGIWHASDDAERHAGDAVDDEYMANTVGTGDDWAFLRGGTGVVLARELGILGKGDDPALWPEPFPREYPT